MSPNPPQALLQLICSLELSLHQHTVRADKAKLLKLLHPDFVEIGRSGQRYTHAQMFAHLLEQRVHAVVWSQDFALTMPSYSVALLTYRSAHVEGRGELSLHSQRSSLWQFTDGSWQLRFHQGTACPAFARNDTAPQAALQEHAT